MALDKVLKIYDENGNSVDYDILASDVKFLPDGKDLPTKLTEMEDAIEDAAEGGGYTPPQGGIPKRDLTQSVQDSLELADSSLQPSDKTQLQNAINSLQSALDTLIGSGNVQGAIDTFNEVKAFLNGIDTDDPTLFNQLKSLSDAITALQTSLNSKANDNAVVKSVSVNGTAQTKDGNGNVNITVEAGGLTKEDISVETQGDGTVAFNVKDDTYTINLNHTHEGMVKLEKYTEATMPQTKDDDTIYVQVDDVTTPQAIEALYIFGLEFTGGGAAPGTPAINTIPGGSTLNLGENDGTGVEGTITVKGRNLTGGLTVAVAANSGLSLTYGQTTGTSVTIPQADAEVVAGAVVTVSYSGSGALDLADGLSISGGGASAKYMKVVVAEPALIELDGVKFTGTQWIGTDYYPNPKTEFALELTFEVNSNTGSTDSSIGRVFMSCIANSSPTSHFSFYHFNHDSANDNRVYAIQVLNEGDVSNQNLFVFNAAGTPTSSTIQKIMTPHSVLRYTVGSSNNHLAFEPGGVPEADNTYYTSVNMQKKTSTMTNPLALGLHAKSSGSVVYSRFNLTIHRLTITEDGVAVRDYVPRIKGGVTGLLDIAQNGTGLFLTSETADELVAVPLSNS